MAKSKRTPEYRSRYPLLLPRTDDMTPRWQRIAQLAEAQPDTFEIIDIPNGFRKILRRNNPSLTKHVELMLGSMIKTGKTFTILDIDPIQSISPMLRSTWLGRGYEVADVGIIVIQFPGSDKAYQYPFLQVAQLT